MISKCLFKRTYILTPLDMRWSLKILAPQLSIANLPPFLAILKPSQAENLVLLFSFFGKVASSITGTKWFKSLKNVRR